MKKNVKNKTYALPVLPLVPAWILIPLWMVSLALPNLVYSGVLFADTLHILKWTVTGVPVALALIVAGLRLVRYGTERITLKLDNFAVIWLVILVYCAIQPLWVKLLSPTGYVLEMVCFACVWAFYVLSVSSFPEWGLKIALLLANINAAVNVMFAELQIRDMNNLRFLEGTIFSDIIRYSNIILPTPGNYIGNTAQQNMFGLWCAVAVLGAVWLSIHSNKNEGRKAFLPALCVALAAVALKFAVADGITVCYAAAGVCLVAAFILSGKTLQGVTLTLAAVNFWGLMNSTSRSATLALTGGIILMFLLTAWKFQRQDLVRFGAVMVVLCAVFWVSMYSERSGQIVGKTIDIIQNAENIGNRRGIWATSYAMFLEHPEGVGVGQYKWHYLEAQRYGFKLMPYDWYTWQYTHWAHNEFLQFFCEGGVAGGCLLVLMWMLWLVPAVIGLFKRKEISRDAVWALCLVSLITFCGLFTRPFHRIENMVWIALAFALSNREFLSQRFSIRGGLRKVVGLACVVSAVAGCVYIYSGIAGNYILRQALSTQNADLQMYYLERSAKHPITYEESMRNIGYHYMQRGEQTDDGEMLSNGFNLLWEHFNHEPHSEDISRLLQYAQKYQIEPVLRELASYFRPGTYHLRRIPQKDADGSVVNALLLVNGPGSDDD
ncbi:MAG: O-antigen ligase family protein [Synergistaceae bacterium]|nr:O-antigen ligase family protein [Synergistaceae bacterium]